MPVPLKKLFAPFARMKIGNKLFAMFVLVVGLAIFPIARHVLHSVTIFGDYSTRIYTEQIRGLALSHLSDVSYEQGKRFTEYFTKMASVMTLLAGEAEDVYADLTAHAFLGDSDLKLHLEKENGMHLTPPDEAVVSLYWGGEKLSAGIKKELRALSTLDRLMQESCRLIPEVLATHTITVSGIGRYYTENEAARQGVRHLPPASTFDLRDGAPLTVFSEAESLVREVRWTRIYKDDVIDGLMVTASAPIISKDGVLHGIMGLDLPLETLIDDVLAGGALKQDEGGQVRFSFLLSDTGDIIAFPLSLLPRFGFDASLENFQNSDDILSYNLKDSARPEVREVASRLLEDENSIEELILDNEKHLLACQTLPVNGWKLVLVAREATLLSTVEHNQKVLERVIVSLKIKFLLYSFGIGVILLICSYLAVKYFVSPLQKLTQLAQNVGEGELSQTASIARKDELGELAEAMNQMIESLAAGEKLKEKYFQELENGVEMRTLDLERKNRHLKDAVRIIRSESKKRQKISVALTERERQIRAIMEASLAGICIVQNKKFKYVNSAIVRMFGYAKDELIGKLGPIDLVAPEFNSEVLQRIMQRQKGGYNEQNPHYVKCRRKSGEVFDVEVDGSFVTWQGAPASVGTLVDISEHVAAEKQLKIKEQHLQSLLEEKELLLREVYHRTKNNMLVIISMIALQIDDIEDGAARKMFEDMENRIRAMALVHENLYQSESLVEINLGEYLAKLARTQVEHMTLTDQITVLADYCQVTVPFDRAIPVGLVVSELVTNCVKYAFPDGVKGVLHLELKRKKELLELIVADNGVGFAPDYDGKKTTSFGLQITTNMIEKQLGGRYRIERGNGTAFHIEFKPLGDHD